MTFKWSEIYILITWRVEGKYFDLFHRMRNSVILIKQSIIIRYQWRSAVWGAITVADWWSYDLDIGNKIMSNRVTVLSTVTLILEPALSALSLPTFTVATTDFVFWCNCKIGAEAFSPNSRVKLSQFSRTWRIFTKIMKSRNGQS